MSRFYFTDVIYFGVVVPIAALARVVRYDFMDLKPARRSLWHTNDSSRVSKRIQRAADVLKRDRGQRPRYILGISAHYHDSAVALLRDGDILAAAQEERFTRCRHDSRFPIQAVRYCLREAGISGRDVALVVFYEDPLLKFVRLCATFVGFAPRGRMLFRAAAPVLARHRLWSRTLVLRQLTCAMGVDIPSDKLLFSEHHLSHAASAFFASPFQRAAILTMDGVGEFATTTIAVGAGSKLSILKEIRFPHSLGLLYSAFTVYCGFKVNSGEYKLMGLAPYGTPRMENEILRRLIELKADGSFWLNMQYFEYGRDVRTISTKFETLFGAPARRPDGPISQFYMDIAASVQSVLEKAIIALASSVARETRECNLCLAGGVALNCVANGKLLRSGLFRSIWVQPAAGDAGGALGAAYVGDVLCAGVRSESKVEGDAMKGTYLGPAYTTSEAARSLRELGARFSVRGEEEIDECVARLIAEEKVVGWMSGRMEFGPRALGARSILANPSSATMQAVLNEKIKGRESFRPFAPAVIQEETSTWFELDRESPYMLFAASVRAKQCTESVSKLHDCADFENHGRPGPALPAVTHVDNSARVQTVNSTTSPRLYRLLCAIRRRTGIGIVVNTSFNVRGEPLVCSVEDAFRCFMGTDIDALVVENCILYKDDQDPHLKTDSRALFPTD